MPKFISNKVVRGNILGWHQAAGHKVEYKKLEGKELIDALCKKLYEEADEVAGSSDKDDMTEELADVQQIIDDICDIAGIDKQSVEAARKDKLAQKGGFQDGIFIDTVDIPDENDKMAKYCRAQPDKYPEIS